MTLGKMAVELQANFGGYFAQMQAAKKELDALNKMVRPVKDSLKDLGQMAVSAGKTLTVAVTAPIAAVAGLGIAFNAMQEQAQIAFTTMLGDGQKAKVFLNDLKNFAAATPFEFPDLVRASQRLMAMGFAAKDVKPLLTSVGNAVAGLGGGAAEIDRITLALGQMQGRGRIATQEMNQLTEAGIPAWKMLAEGFGIAESKIRDMVEKGAVPAGRSIEILIAGMDSRFGNMMDKQSRTFSGLMSTIKDEARFLAGDLTESLFNALKGPAEALTKTLHDIRTEMKGWSDETKTAVLVVGGLAAAAGPLLFIVGQLALSITSIMKLASDLPILFSAIKGAMAALTFEMALATAGITALVGAFVLLIKAGEESRAAHKDERQTAIELGAATQKLADQVAAAGGPIIKNSTNLGEWNRKVIEAAKGIKNLNPELTAKIKADTDAAKATADAAKATADHNAQLGLQVDGLKKFRSAVDSLKNSVIPTAEDANALNVALLELGKQGVPLQMIVDGIGKKATETAKALRELGQAVPPMIQAIAEAETDQRIQTILINNTLALSKELGAQEDIWQKHLDKELDALEKTYVSMNKMTEDWLQRDEMTLARLPEGVMRPPQVPTFDTGTLRQADDAAEKWKESGQRAINQITEDISRMFTGMIANGKSFWEAFKGLGKSAIAAIADTFMSTVLHSMLDTAAKRLGEWIDTFKKKLVDLGDFLKKNLSTVGLITGGAAIGGAIGGTRGAIAGGAAGLAADQLIKGNWIAGAIAGVAALGVALSGLFGSLRRQADKFVDTIQNPMTDAVGKLFESLNAAKEAGTLTVEQAQAAKGAFEDMWAKFQQSAAAAGVVGQQALATLNQYVPQWREWFDAIAVGAKDAEDAAQSMGSLADQLERLADINSELTDTFGELGDALNSTIDQIDSGLAESLRNVKDWTDELRAKTESAEQNRLQNIIDTTADLSTYYRTQKQLADLNQRIKDEQQTNDLNSIQALRNNIELEKQRIETLQSEHDKIIQLMDAAGIARLSENDKVLAGINSLILRGTMLEQERDSLNALVGAGQEAAHVFSGLADILAGFSLSELANPQVELPQFSASGDSFVPYASVNVTPRSTTPEASAGTPAAITYNITQTINAKVIDKETVDYMHAELMKKINQGGAQPLIRKLGR